MKIVFRCDGGKIKEIGTGHITRCILMAKELRRRKHQIIFIVAGDAFAFTEISKAGFKTHPIKNNQKDNVVTAAARLRPDILVIDALERENKYIPALKQKFNIPIVQLDAVKGHARKADIRINAMIQDKTTPYSNYNYVILPPIKAEKKPPAKVKTLFLSFGGYDANQIMEKTLKAISQIPHKIHIIAVPGSCMTPIETLNSTIKARGHTIYWARNRDNFDSLLKKSDYAIVAGGLTLFHALSLGIPAAVVSQYEHQKETAERLLDTLAVDYLGAGDLINLQELKTSIIRILKLSRSQLKESSAVAKNIADRNGNSRVCDLIEILRPLAWDTKHFKKNIARVNCACLTPSIITYVNRVCAEKKIETIYYLADISDSTSSQLAELSEFHMKDIRVTMSRKIKEGRTRSKIKTGTWKISKAKKSDLNSMRKISRNAYTASRFYHDDAFSKPRVEDLYLKWMEQSVSTKEQFAYIARDSKSVAGYITCKVISDHKLEIVLVNVAETYRGQGVGELLMRTVVNKHLIAKGDEATIVTQGRNIAAQRLYQKCGFYTNMMQIWYHKTFSRGR